MSQIILCLNYYVFCKWQNIWNFFYSFDNLTWQQTMNHLRRFLSKTVCCFVILDSLIKTNTSVIKWTKCILSCLMWSLLLPSLFDQIDPEWQSPKLLITWTILVYFKICFYSVNVISFSWAQNDHIMQLLLWFNLRKVFKSKMFVYSQMLKVKVGGFLKFFAKT